MIRWVVERRLADVSGRLRRAREELRIAAEQLEHLGADADEARIRTLVSDNALASHEYREAQGPADALARENVRLAALIAELHERQDRLLAQLSEGSDHR